MEDIVQAWLLRITDLEVRQKLQHPVPCVRRAEHRARLCRCCSRRGAPSSRRKSLLTHVCALTSSRTASCRCVSKPQLALSRTAGTYRYVLAGAGAPAALAAQGAQSQPGERAVLLAA